MQAFSSWAPPTGVLGGLVDAARERARVLHETRAELHARAAAAPSTPSLLRALARADVAVIAEVKRRSPSKGWINPGLTAAAQAAAYERGGAAAISVLTEPAQFGGSNADLEAVRAATTVAVLKKDFHVDPLQLVEARAIGASAALLIARALDPTALADMVAVAGELELETIVEVRDERELALALALGAPIIGINNRNLETLAIDPSTSERLLASIPRGVIAIAESGVSARVDVERVAARGADAVLVGSSISGAADAESAVRALVAVPKASRAA